MEVSFGQQIIVLGFKKKHPSKGGFEGVERIWKLS
jgi:hypothetical protein